MASRIDNSKEFLVEIAQASDLEVNDNIDVNVVEAGNRVIDEIDAIQNAMQDAISNDDVLIDETETAAGEAGSAGTSSSLDFLRDAQETLASSTFSTDAIELGTVAVDFIDTNIDLPPPSDNTATFTPISDVAPSLVISSSGNHLSSAEVAVITFTFSEATSSFENSDISVQGGSLGVVSSVDGGLTYSALFIQSGTDAPSISVGDTLYSDADGNAGTGDELALNLAPIATDDDTSSIFTATIGSPDGVANVWASQNQSPTSERFTHETEVGNKITISGTQDGVVADIGYINRGISHHGGTGIGVNGEINPSIEVTVDFGGTVNAATEIGLGGLGGHFNSNGNNPKNAKALWTAYDSDGLIVASGELQEDANDLDGDGHSQTVSFMVGVPFSSITFATVSDSSGSNYTLQYINAVYEILAIGVSEDTVLTIEASTLLENDSDLDSDASLLIISNVVASDDTHGTVQLEENGNVIFTPEKDYHGTASFVYTVMDADGGTDTAVAFLTVAPVNDAPVITALESLVIDADSDELMIATVTDLDSNIATVNSNVGSVRIDNDGNVIYTSERDGEVETIVLTVTDDSGLDATETIVINNSEAPNIIAGTDADDLLIGGDGIDTFVWSKGDMGTDTIENFNLNEGDRLDLSDLLNLDVGDDLDEFIDFTSAGGDTTLTIYANGSDALTQSIVLDGVDLGDDDANILNDLLLGKHEGALFIGDNWAVDEQLMVAVSDDF